MMDSRKEIQALWVSDGWGIIGDRYRLGIRNGPCGYDEIR